MTEKTWRSRRIKHGRWKRPTGRAYKICAGIISGEPRTGFFCARPPTFSLRTGDVLVFRKTVTATDAVGGRSEIDDSRRKTVPGFEKRAREKYENYLYKGGKKKTSPGAYVSEIFTVVVQNATTCANVVESVG